ncbi:nitrate reductase [Chromobacterium haemolyticum]|uniref:nitrate reductase n=1 Tax=Chromobacterium haemolyticum TaxID=394935 RepID=UPI000D31DE88|nr:nitrate reductase [Chromobacterium haemolyticum]PTU68960.1 nitrate reductase [Chromobacterium haemolyticum]
MTTTPSTCCYCGVGCGVLIHSDGARVTGVEGDPAHPANHGRLCTKGLALADSCASLSGRALHPELRLTRDAARRRVDWDSALDTVAERLAGVIRRHGPDAVAVYASGQLLTEDYYLFNKLTKGLIGTNNIDTNSRLCMSSAVSGYKLALGADGPPTCYQDLDLADCVLLAGSNTAYAHPVLFRRLEAAKAARPDTKWIVVDPRRTDTAALADLHLQIQPGSDVALFNGMLHHLIWEGLIDERYIAAHTEGFDALKRLLRDYSPRQAAGLCGIAEAELTTAAEWFGRSPASLSLYCMGLNQSRHGTAKNLALINLHLAAGQIGRPGAGPFSLTGQPNAMGGREVGGMATMLAAHHDIANPRHRAEVAAHWGVPPERLSDRPGLPAIALFDALKAGQVKAVWIVCTNPAHSLPDLEQARQALAQAEFVIVQDAYADTDTAACADALLPAASWGEKEGAVTNSERRVSRVRAAVPPPGEARADGWIAAEVGRRLERLLYPDAPSLFQNSEPAAVFAEHAALTAGRDLDISGLSHARLERDGPQQWPYPAGAAAGQARRYEDGRFPTANGRAQFHVTPYRPPADAVNARYPFRLLTGRLRDQWHGMSRSGRVARLFSHAPEPTLDMHPADAVRRGLKAGELVSVESRRGSLVLPLALSEDLPGGCVFAAMHWSGQHLNSGGVNQACSPAVDAQSFQPELKHAAVRVERAELPWRVRAASRHPDLPALRARLQPLLAGCGYAALSLRPPDILVLNAAHAQARPDWLSELTRLLDLDGGPQLQTFSDARRGLEQRIAWRDDAPWAFVFAGGQDDGARLLAAMQSGQPWPGNRLSALVPGAASAPAAARIVCNCLHVDAERIQTAIAAGADLAGLKARLGCGGVCGSCLPELKRMLTRQTEREY